MEKNYEERKRIGSEIAAIRKAKGMTQQDLAVMVGMERAHIARIELGKYSVGLDTLAAIAEAFRMKIKFVPKKDTRI